MKLFYDFRTINLPRTQWTRPRPWPIRLTLAIAAALIALATWLTTQAETAESYAAAIRIVYAAGQVAARVVWDDLSYGVAEALLGRGMERAYLS